MPNNTSTLSHASKTHVLFPLKIRANSHQKQTKTAMNFTQNAGELNKVSFREIRREDKEI